MSPYHCIPLRGNDHVFQFFLHLQSLGEDWAQRGSLRNIVHNPDLEGCCSPSSSLLMEKEDWVCSLFPITTAFHCLSNLSTSPCFWIPNYSSINSLVPLDTKPKIIHTLVFPITMFGCEKVGQWRRLVGIKWIHLKYGVRGELCIYLDRQKDEQVGPTAN